MQSLRQQRRRHTILAAAVNREFPFRYVTPSDDNVDYMCRTAITNDTFGFFDYMLADNIKFDYNAVMAAALKHGAYGVVRSLASDAERSINYALYVLDHGSDEAVTALFLGRSDRLLVAAARRGMMRIVEMMFERGATDVEAAVDAAPEKFIPQIRETFKQVRAV